MLYFLPLFTPIFFSAYDKLKQKQHLEKEWSVSFLCFVGFFL